MKILLSWLREYVDVPGTPEAIARTMSVRGFAVEGIAPAADGDAVIDFEVTANRPDCMSVVGIAREVATAYQLPLRLPSAPALSHARGAASAEPIAITIEAPDLCPRYVGAVADVTVGPSPAWMQTRLTAAGVRPISNIVDITNYILLELGQPMHAFDITHLAGGQIVVRRAAPGERLTTLDGQDRALSTDMLVIADANRPVAVAGVMGGGNSEVGAQTRTIVFESAYFAPLSVRRTSKKLGLKTEASMRFERGTDAALPLAAMERACALLQQIGAGTPRGSAIDCAPLAIAPTVLRLRRARITGVLGLAIEDSDVERLLNSLGFGLEGAPNGWDVTVPTRRVDVVREIDLIEELARHYGLDRIPVTFPPVRIAPARMDPRAARARQLRGVMNGLGFSEAVTFGFVSAAAAAPFADAEAIVPIANPLSETFAVLRPSALPGLIEAVAHNRRREQRDVRLFEVGACFDRTHGERRRLACVWTGASLIEHWSGPAKDVDFFDVAAVAERVADALGLTAQVTPARASWLVAGRAGTVSVQGTAIGLLGQLTPEIADRHGIPGGDAVYVLDLDLDAAERLVEAADRRVVPLPRFPSVVRDISILVSDTLPAANIRSTIRNAAPDTLVDVREFDRYQGKGVPDGQVSLSFHLTFRATDRTLTDQDVQQAMDQVLEALITQHHAVRR